MVDDTNDNQFDVLQQDDIAAYIEQESWQELSLSEQEGHNTMVPDMNQNDGSDMTNLDVPLRVPSLTTQSSAVMIFNHIAMPPNKDTVIAPSLPELPDSSLIEQPEEYDEFFYCMRSEEETSFDKTKTSHVISSQSESIYWQNELVL